MAATGGGARTAGLSSPSRLVVRDAVVEFGGLRALDGVSLQVSEGDSVGLIGPNGAGKTTMFNVVAGSARLSAGDVRFGGKRIDTLRAEKVARLGIRRTFQTVKLFRSLTVRDNVRLGLRGTSPVRGSEHAVEEWLEKCGLLRLADRLPGEITLAEQKRVEVARASITRPRILLLDEMMNGLTQSETHESVELVKNLREEVGAIVVVEHVLSVIRHICSRVIVLDYGRVICEGTPDSVVRDERVKESYLGV